MKVSILNYEDLKITATECKSFRSDGQVYHVSVYYNGELMYAHPTFEDSVWTAINEVLCLYRERDDIPYSCFLSYRNEIPKPCLDNVNSLLDALKCWWGNWENPYAKFDIKEIEI